MHNVGMSRLVQALEALDDASVGLEDTLTQLVDVFVHIEVVGIRLKKILQMLKIQI